MARRTIVALEDDLDGGPADETVRFGVSGAEYEIDLSEKNAAKLRKQLAPFVDHARRASGQPHRPVRTAASRRRSRDIRAWAQAQGIQLSERGRIPANIAAQYEAEAGRGSRRLAAGPRPRRQPAPSPRRADILYLTPGPGAGRLAGAPPYSARSSQVSWSSVAVSQAVSRSWFASVPGGSSAASVTAAAAVSGRAPSAARSW
jgi:nucleoid-associated protein Lsr2